MYMSWFREHVEKPIIDVYIKKKRSPLWRKVRKAFIKNNPRCSICNTNKKLQVHHVQDFSNHPNLELDHSNLITLCMFHDCHLIFGHLGYWKSINKNLLYDAKWMRDKILNRP